ncbi:uncharacterized protein BYT42DRAFT_602205 [Radiomyces spectabilis]|uniref:uncharacterized protein n=1 Tax=Radiomyces spectabilis TaxID=64574 RepID=UPI002220FEC0|nr:uncharacterized protein BYT42DRAFT_602205 [Radiomyces spectabilis]KAI8391340.1 hypothetical protein BYT42DRAFT_602205 [Radiomyces spectabilis]
MDRILFHGYDVFKHNSLTYSRQRHVVAISKAVTKHHLFFFEPVLPKLSHVEEAADVRTRKRKQYAVEIGKTDERPSKKVKVHLGPPHFEPVLPKLWPTGIPPAHPPRAQKRANDVAAVCSPSVCPQKHQRAAENDKPVQVPAAKKQKLVAGKPTVVVRPPPSACPKKRQWAADDDQAPFEERPSKKAKTLNKGKSVAVPLARVVKAEPLWLLQLRLVAPIKEPQRLVPSSMKGPNMCIPGTTFVPVVTATPLDWRPVTQ